MERIGTALDGAAAYLRANPAEARYTDSAAVASVERGLRVRVAGPRGEELTTDMVGSVGGDGSAPSPGWYLRAAQASCVATLIAMRAAWDGVVLDILEVTVDSESDDRGILGLDPSVPAGPLRSRVRVVASGAAPRETIDRIARWGIEHCPVCDAVKRAVPMDIEVDIR